MKKTFYLLICTCAFCSALIIQSCQKDAMAEFARKLTRNKPEVFSEISGKNNTLSIVIICEDGLIGNLEQPHVNMLVAENAPFFKKLGDMVGETEESTIRIIYKSKENGDNQTFDFTTDELRTLIENPEKTIQEAKEELATLEE